MTVAVNDANVVSFINNNAALHAVALANPGADQPLIEACNQVVSSVSVPGDMISASQFLSLLDGAELGAMSTPQVALVTLYASVQNLEMGDSSIQSKLDTLFSQFPTSLAAVRSKYTRNGSRWEGQFGKGLQADQNTLDKARNSGDGHNF